MTDNRNKLVSLFPLAVTAGVLLGAAGGYTTRLLQDHRASKPTMVVDVTWMAEARHCWKGLATWTDSDIRYGLSSPPVFRSTFSEYSENTDAEVKNIAEKTPAAADQPKQDKWAKYAGNIDPKTGELITVAIDPQTGERISSKPQPDCTMTDGLPFGFTPK